MWLLSGSKCATCFLGRARRGELQSPMRCLFDMPERCKTSPSNSTIRPVLHYRASDWLHSVALNQSSTLQGSLSFAAGFQCNGGGSDRETPARLIARSSRPLALIFMPRGVYLCFLILVAIAAVQIAFASTATFVDEQLVPTPPHFEDEMSFPQFRITKSLVSKHLTPEIFEQLKGLKTGHGFTLADAIRSAVEQQDSSVGIYAGDVESYTLFWPLLGPIISDFHKRPLVADLHAVKKEDLWYQHTDWSYMAHLADDDPTLLVDTGSGDKNYILSTRIRLSRNLAHYPLPPALSDEQRHQVEDELKGVLLSMKDVHEELSGNYESIADMTKERVEELEEAHRIFQQEPDRFLHSAGLDGDWPNGRGVFYTDDWTKMVWVNEEDHMRVIALDVKGGSGAFIRAMKDLGQLHEALKQKTSFAFDDMIGYISSCPTNLGTGLRASSHVRLPLVAERAPEQFDAIVAKYHLQKRGLRGEHTESVGGVYDISNQERLGASVVDYVRLVVEGLKELILLEKSLEQQSKI